MYLHQRTREFEIRAYMHWELAIFYGCSKQTLRRRIKPFRKELGPGLQVYYNPKQVAIIVAKLGWPKRKQERRNLLRLALGMDIARARRIFKRTLCKPVDPHNIIPTLAEFEEEFHKLFLEAEDEKEEFYENARAIGLLAPDGISVVPTFGSAKMVLKKSDELYHWFLTVPNDPHKLYAIELNDGEVSISFRHLLRDRNEMPKEFIYQILATGLKEKFGWKIVCDIQYELPKSIPSLLPTLLP
jgi:hypothetical protein